MKRVTQSPPQDPTDVTSARVNRQPIRCSANVYPSLTILVVDDTALIRNMILLFLRQEGAYALSAANAEEALSLANNCPEFDLLITDFQMPGMNGLELASQIHRTHPKTKILLISGALLEASQEVTTLPPWISFLPKPFGPGELLRKVREATSPREQEEVKCRTSNGTAIH